MGGAERTEAHRHTITTTATDREGQPVSHLAAARLQAQLDTDFTDRVIAATGPKTDSRLARIMPSLIRHLHDFAREVDLTVSEWAAGVELVSRPSSGGGGGLLTEGCVLQINQAGRMSDNKRNETQLLCDILGLESLVDDLTSRQLQRPGSKATPSAVLGPFYRAAAPTLPLGASIVQAPSLSDGAKGATWYAEASARRTRVSKIWCSVLAPSARIAPGVLLFSFVFVVST